MESILSDFTRRDWQTEDDIGPIRFAMVGLGQWMRKHGIPAMTASEYCEPTVVVSSSAEKREAAMAVADTVEHALTYEEYQRGEAADAYDAVYVATPNALHLPHVEAAAHHGKDVLCEKPLEATVERAESVVEVCEDMGVTLMTAYRMQASPVARRARELVEAGVIGRPILVNGSMSQRLLKMIPDETQWRFDPDVAGYGVSLMDLGVYPLNTARFIIDDDPVAVQGATLVENDLFADVGDEHAAFQLEFSGGALAGCTASQNAAHSSHLRITGTDGEIRIEPAYYNRQERGFHLQVGEDVDAETFDVGFERVNQMTEEYDYFAHHVATGTRPHADGEHGLVDVRTMAAVVESAASGERVTL